MIENLKDKLNGKIPVTIDELFELVNSHGRTNSFYRNIDGNNIRIEQLSVAECHPLENLDVSQINDFSNAFKYSPYNGDLSKWNMSNATTLENMFYNSNFNNDSLKDWDVSNVQNMTYLFCDSNFNGDISNWNVSNVVEMNYLFRNTHFNGDLSKWDLSNCKNISYMFAYSEFNNDSIKNWNVSNVISMEYLFYESSFDKDISLWEFNKDVKYSEMFTYNKNFRNKYNDGIILPQRHEDIKLWLKENLINIREINTTKEEVLDFFTFDEQKEIGID